MPTHFEEIILHMIIKYRIDKKYVEPEIHICAEAQNLRAKEIYDAVTDIFEKRVRVYDGEETVMLRAAEIVRVFAAAKQVFVSTEERQFKIRERLYEMEELLGKESFVRISNSEIVNIRKIKRLDTSVTGTIRMQLRGDIETYVSRRYVTRIKQMLGLCGKDAL